MRRWRGTKLTDRARARSLFVPGLIIGLCLGFVANEVLPPLAALLGDRPAEPVAEVLEENVEETPVDTVAVPEIDEVIADQTGSPDHDPGAPPVHSSTGLIIPVAGVEPSELYDSFDDGRSGGRVHNALDIVAPEGTPVLAAIDGEILRRFTSDRGGLTIYQRGVDGRIYYYAHLRKYAPGVLTGRRVRAGEVIAYVGNTGNAGPDNHHLHFAVWVPEDSSSYWNGTPVNPYPLLRP